MNCTCPLAGYCETHKRQMTPRQHAQCRDEPGMFAAFASRAAKPSPCTNSRGLGDTIAKITAATGIDRVVRTIERATGKPCGCGERQQKLNAFVPYGATPPVRQPPT